MTIGGVVGFFYLLATFSSFVAYDASYSLNGLGLGESFGGYLILCCLVLFGSGMARLKERKSQIFDNALVVLVLLVIIPYVLYYTLLRH